MKVGIANVKSPRIDSWITSGWELLFKTEQLDGFIALQLETELLRWIRKDLELPIHLGVQDIGKLRGWSETFAVNEIDDQILMQKIQANLAKLRSQ